MKDDLTVVAASCWGVRVAGLPVGSCVADMDSSILQSVNQYLKLFSVIKKDLKQLYSSLYDIISNPALSDSDRKSFLKIKRICRKAEQSDLLDPLRTLLEYELINCFPIVNKLREEYRTLLSLFNEIQEQYYNAISRRKKLLYEIGKSECIMQGLSISAPYLCKTISKYNVFNIPKQKQRKIFDSLDAYSSRVERKTSPFSSFTKIGLLINGHPIGSSHCSITVLPSLKSIFLKADLNEKTFLVSTIGEGDHIFLAKNTNYLIKPCDIEMKDFFFAVEDVCSFDSILPEIMNIQRPLTVKQWQDRLSVPEETIRILVEDGLLRFAADRFAEAENYFDMFGDAKTNFTAQAKAIIDRLESAYNVERQDLISKLRSLGHSASNKIGSFSPSWLEKSPLVFESCGANASEIPIVTQTEVDEALNDIKNGVAPFLRLSKLYPVLIDAYFSFKRPGKPLTLAEFVLRCASSPSFDKAVARAALEDRLRIDSSSINMQMISPGGTLGIPSFTAFLQPYSEGDYDAPDFVLNELNQGSGGLLARWAGIGDYDLHIAEQLNSWLNFLFSGADCVAFIPGARFSSLQRAPMKLRKWLRWPSSVCVEGCDTSRAVDLSDIEIWFDTARGSLQLTRLGSQHPVALPYLGTVPQHLLNGVSKIILSLSDPWVYQRDTMFKNGVKNVVDSAFGKLTIFQRGYQGATLTSRKKWVLNGNDLTMKLTTSTDDSVGFIAVRKWCQEVGMPSEVFFRAVSMDPFNKKLRKPQYFRLDDPFSVSRLMRELKGKEQVIFEEAVPSSGSFWNPAGSKVNEIMVPFAIEGRRAK